MEEILNNFAKEIYFLFQLKELQYLIERETCPNRIAELKQIAKMYADME